MSVIFFGAIGAIGAAASARACQIPTSTLSVKLSTGAPTMMPSKSPNKTCEWRRVIIEKACHHRMEHHAAGGIV
jgi:hypothetical protein